MNSIENSFFSLLTKDRRESSTLLQKPSTRGIMKSVVEKYSDQAHFIYELLQNADDAKASYARFVLFKDKLVFAHNGSRHFSISNPKTEDIDSSKGILGDINAITSIANSNKSTEATIGKFGVAKDVSVCYDTSPNGLDKLPPEAAIAYAHRIISTAYFAKSVEGMPVIEPEKEDLAED